MIKLKSLIIETTSSDMMNHILNIIKKYNINVKYVSIWDSLQYDTELGIAYIYKEIKNELGYWECLHELGHAINKHKSPKNWNEEAKMEIDAWNFVINNSIIPIPIEVKQKWEHDRIKGDLETQKV